MKSTIKRNHAFLHLLAMYSSRSRSRNMREWLKLPYLSESLEGDGDRTNCLSVWYGLGASRGIMYYLGLGRRLEKCV